MLIDCFTFLNEIDILRLRLTELAPVVDYFVLVEAGETFSGTRKTLQFEKYRDLFSEFDSRIIYVKLPRLIPLSEDTQEGRFRLEHFNRNAIMMGLLQLDCSGSDVVLISDIDEIPSRDSLSVLHTKMGQDADNISWTFQQFFHKLYFDEEMDDGYNKNGGAERSQCTIAP